MFRVKNCVQAKEVKDKDWAQQRGKYGPHYSMEQNVFIKRAVCVLYASKLCYVLAC